MLGQVNPRFVWNLKSDTRGYKPVFSFKISWLNAPKRIEKTIRENAFEYKKKKSGLKFNPELMLISLRTTGPWPGKSFHVFKFDYKYLRYCGIKCVVKGTQIRGSPIAFFNPVIPTQNFGHSRNPEGYFWHPTFPAFVRSQIPRFKWGKYRIPSFK